MKFYKKKKTEKKKSGQQDRFRGTNLVRVNAKLELKPHLQFEM